MCSQDTCRSIGRANRALYLRVTSRGPMREKAASGPSASRRSLVEASSKLAIQAPFTHRSLQGRGAMPPAAWPQVTLPAAGPALRRRPLPPSPRGAMAAEYVEHAERLRAAEEAV